MDNAFIKAVPIIEKIEEAGFEAYFVGGSVRDFLLGKTIEDVDIATSATPHEIKNIFPKTIDVGIEHGTVVVLYNGESYEITTFRSESQYEDYRRPKEVTFIRSLHEDLSRRDFTMNAIAMDKKGKIIDPFFGRKAIEMKQIKTVGCPKERFSEDALRMMRAVRFVSQLSFTLEEQTKASIEKFAPNIEKIAVERIVVEFEKLLLGAGVKTAIHVLIETDLYRYLPGLVPFKKELLTFSKLVLPKERTIEECWILLLYHFQLSNEELDTFLKKWKLSNKKIKRIKTGLHFLSVRMKSNWTKRSLYEAQLDIAISTEKLYNVIKAKNVFENIDNILSDYEQLPIKKRKELAVTGNDLMKWCRRPGGPWLEELLYKIEDEILMKKLQNEKDKIKEWLDECSLP